MLIFINGKFYTKDKAKISIFDHGLLYGDGIFETLRAYNRKIFRLKNHLQRLRHSCQLISLSLPWTDTYFTKVLYMSLKKNNLSNAYIRVTITRGTGPIGLDISKCKKPALIIISSPYRKYPAEFYTHGVDVAISKTKRNHPLCLNPEIKSLNFLNNILSRIEHKNTFETILCNLYGKIVEGSMSNIFIIAKRTIMTPPIKDGLLPGITRQVVIEIAHANGIPIKEVSLWPENLYTAEECFLTNTSLEIMPVRTINGHKIKQVPGKLTNLLITKFKELVCRETK